jgi:hypothetical protein
MNEITRAELDEHIRYGLLRTVKRSAEGELLREIADAVLAGHITWSGALRSGVYAEALVAFLDTVNDDPDALSDDVLERCAQEARAFEQRLSDYSSGQTSSGDSGPFGPL